MKMRYFCLKHRQEIAEGKVLNWCRRFDCWAFRKWRNTTQLNRIKQAMNPEQIRKIKKDHFCTRIYNPKPIMCEEEKYEHDRIIRGNKIIFKGIKKIRTQNAHSR